MPHESCPGYGAEPFRTLADDYPGEDAYPRDGFRTEWGPVFHRGRLDGTARLLVIGQDPAAHEAIARRILVGEAGQRVQGLLARLGLDRSYVFVNAFLYSVYGQRSESHVADEGITAYRNRWLDAIAATSPVQGVITLGRAAERALRLWPGGAALRRVAALHPTYPDAASRAGVVTLEEGMRRLCASWNAALDVLAPAVTPDRAVPLRPYGNRLEPGDLARIPEADLPAGTPPWMRDLEGWAARTGATAGQKRATITVTVPPSAAWWLA
ncbi:MAG TPA: uracil-DNA glycosylase family protein [Jiangellales bacterium]|nr:uracil-DNA glycosylase family protein [Jiangellales bacterium]